MKAAGIMALVGVGAVAACATAPAPQPVPGAAFRQGSGHALTADGAVPVAGMTVAVTDFAYDQGLPAKRKAEAACIASGMSFNAAAVGRYAAPEWVFPGACA